MHNYTWQRGDKISLTELNHMSYNNLTFESDRKTLRHDSYRRGRLGIQEMPMYNGFRGSRVNVSEYREHSGAFQPARTIRLRRQRSLGHPLFTVFPGWGTQRLGSSESSSWAPSKGLIKNPLLQEQRPACHSWARRRNTFGLKPKCTRPDRESRKTTFLVIREIQRDLPTGQLQPVTWRVLIKAAQNAVSPHVISGT